MKKYFLLIVVITVVSCQTEIERSLKEVDLLLNEEPSSALEAINTIDSMHIKRKKDLAYYALLKSAALDKNYIDVANDSLINIAVKYYSNHNDRYNRMRSRYYQGIVKHNNNDYASAIVSLEMAKRDAIELNELRYVGLTNRNIGEIFNATSNFPEAIKYTRLAIKAFEENRDTIYTDYATYSLSVMFYNEGGRSDSCRLLLNRILKEKRLEKLHPYAARDLAHLYVARGDSIPRAINIFQNTSRALFWPDTYGYCALAFAYLGQKDSCEQWIRNGYEHYKTQAERGTINSLIYRVDSLNGNYLAALNKIQQVMKAQDTRTRSILQQSLSIAQKEYYRQEMEARQMRLGQQRRLLVVVIAVSVLLLAFVYLAMKRRQEETDSRQRELMAQLAIDANKVQKEKSRLIGSLFVERLSHLAGLSTQYYTSDQAVEKDGAFRRFKESVNELRGSNEFFKGLETELNQHCACIMEKLREQVPDIKGGNRKIIALFFAGIPDIYIQAITNRVSVESLKTLRSRFRATIKEAHAADEALFLTMLTRS